MDFDERVKSALDRAWEAEQAGAALESDLPAEIAGAVEEILAGDSNPNRQFLLTIAAGTAHWPDSNPASLQVTAGVDRRGQEQIPRRVLTDFRNDKQLTLKISQDAGVSNQWRAVEIDESWVNKRRVGKDRAWAQGFFTIVRWLSSFSPGERGSKAQSLLDHVSSRIISHALTNQLNYPKFRVTPRRAFLLVRDFLEEAPDRPDAIEAITTVAARTLCAAVSPQLEVQRRDINSPDPIDVLLLHEALPYAGIEVTDEYITLGKLEHEVVPAMLTLGLSRASVLSRGVAVGQEEAIEEFVARAFSRFEQRIDLITIDTIEAWLNFPGVPDDIATAFLWAVGSELDEFSKDANRRKWLQTLTAYASDARPDS